MVNWEGCEWKLHVGWVSCHHSMVSPQVADGEKSSGYGG
jgi:hypothetical protein